MLCRNAILTAAMFFVFAGCLSEDHAGMSPALAPTKAPSTCADALYNVVQAEKAYDAFQTGADQVREAVLAANRLCDQ